MLVVTEELRENSILEYIPKQIRKFLYGVNLDNVEEIRLRKNMPVTITTADGKYILTKKGELSHLSDNAVSSDSAIIENALMLITENSFYSFSDKMVKGYITLSGGHRVGIAGSYSVGEENSLCIREVSGLNYRLAREHIGVCDDIFSLIYNNGDIRNTLIISPPGCGKTTLLRDIIRKLSYKGMNISVVDERHELFSMHNGIPAFDCGPFTDVLDNCSKVTGMEIALRTLSPQVIATDEIGISEFDTVKYIMKCGIKVITTMHGDKCTESEYKNEFENIIFIDYEHKIMCGDV